MGIILRLKNTDFSANSFDGVEKIYTLLKTNYQAGKTYAENATRTENSSKRAIVQLILSSQFKNGFEVTPKSGYEMVPFALVNGTSQFAYSWITSTVTIDISSIDSFAFNLRNTSNTNMSSSLEISDILDIVPL